MYVVTFYSFKGGVGRTLALANAAAELAQTGQRVLVVDFDLEAPGLHTFEAFATGAAQGKGVVDFTRQYLDDRVTPDVKDFLYEAVGVGKDGGRLWVMPAGRFDGEYRSKLASIDWGSLYRDSDGYLLFEDLRAQWEECLSPDYVLIDSRTGYTDVQGICTRQLPNAVVILSFPNTQNLMGLRTVVNEIRNEACGTRKRDICIHFVFSNVPDLDDEQGIWREHRRSFQKQLGYSKLAATIHHYPSLALLDQCIFTREHKKSRLAHEYRNLVWAITEKNVQDRRGVVRFLDRLLRESAVSRYRVLTREVEKKLESILEAHPQDGELSHRIARVYMSEGDDEKGLLQLNRAITLGLRTPDCLLDRAGLLFFVQNKKDLARESVLDALASPELTSSHLMLAARLLRDAPAFPDRLSQAVAFQKLDYESQLRVIRELMFSHVALHAAGEALRRITMNTDITVDLQAHAKNELVLCFIGQGLYEEAIELTKSGAIHLGKEDAADTFNHAMALWARTGNVPRELFAQVLPLVGEIEQEREHPNHLQCMSICYWAAGDSNNALRCLTMAEAAIANVSWNFSCWRYLYCLKDDFLEDCQALRQLIGGTALKPAFMVRRG